MKSFCAILGAGLAMTLAAVAEDMVTLSGQTYSNIVVQQFDDQSLYLTSGTDSVQVAFTDILPELRGRYRSLAWNPISISRVSKEPEAPAGPDDLATLYGGPIYRNVAVKRVEAYAIVIAHDGGIARVYFSEFPKDQWEKYRSGMPTVPDVPAGAKDFVAANGQVFRNVEVVRTEPDGITLRHDGGRTKLWFPSLTEAQQKQYNYEPIAARQYQRDEAAKRRALLEAPPVVAYDGVTPISIYNLATTALPDSEYQIRFSVRNLTDQPQDIKAIPHDHKGTAIVGGKKVTLPVTTDGKMMQMVVPVIQPKTLIVTCGNYQTNCVLTW
jgi:hypothetical protein